MADPDVTDVPEVVLNGVTVRLVTDERIMQRGRCDLNYDWTFTITLRETADRDADRIMLHEFLHALLQTDSQRVCNSGDERHEEFVRMLTTGLYDVLGYRQVGLIPKEADRG